MTVILPLILALGLLIFVHELGHFLVAKAVGVRVLKFCLGFGRSIIS
ncbi:MAG: site-2 protease family protein, partial [Candidatus Krumholzibacteria bacterium]|nr:site-2 protease family protein [Candidatus Krumholzibacteria bacterium]